MISPVITTIDERRHELGWSQAQLADACGTAQSHMSSILRGDSTPTLRVLERMCDAVGLSLSTIYTGRTPPPCQATSPSDQRTSIH